MEYLHTIPPPEYKQELLFEDGDTDDIVTSVMEEDRIDASYMCEFAQNFTNDREGLKKLHDYIFHNFTFQEDPEGLQIISPPAVIQNSGITDCKKISNYIAAILKCNGVPYQYEFTSYTGNHRITHVYPSAILGGRIIPIDPVYSWYKGRNMFGKRRRYTFRKIFKKVGDSITGIETNTFIKDLIRDILLVTASTIIVNRILNF